MRSLRIPSPFDSVSERQEDQKRRALSELTFNVDDPAALSHDAVDRRQAQAGAFVRRFGREQRLENPRFDLGTHAGSSVRDPQQYVRLVESAVAVVPLTRRHDRGLDSDASTTRHRIARVDGEIYQHLLKLTCIGPDIAERRAEP